MQHPSCPTDTLAPGQARHSQGAERVLEQGVDFAGARILFPTIRGSSRSQQPTRYRLPVLGGQARILVSGARRMLTARQIRG